jgi:hypothetical protein
MDRKQVASTCAGGLVILLGVLLLLDRAVPGSLRFFSWPLLVLGVGAVFYLSGIGTPATGLVIPGAIVAGIGGILFWQNLTGRWFSWAYVWTLIPGFVGLGLYSFYRLHPSIHGARDAGRWLLVASGILFLIFTTFLGPFHWFWVIMGLGLIALGGVLLWRGLGRGGKRDS